MSGSLNMNRNRIEDSPIRESKIYFFITLTCIILFIGSMIILPRINMAAMFFFIIVLAISPIIGLVSGIVQVGPFYSLIKNRRYRQAVISACGFILGILLFIIMLLISTEA